MLVNILDGNGAAQKVILKGQEAPIDHSGAISVTGVAQQMLAANVLRSGWVMQNLGANPMRVNDLGTATVGAGSFQVAVGAFFPPEGYPVSTGAVSILGTATDVYSVREW